jgi:vesicle-fusing ATPase
LIIATTTERAVLKQLDIYNSFNSDIKVPNVETYEELALVLEQSNEFAPQEIQQALQGIGGIVDHGKIGVGIKRILLAIETAKQDIDNKVGRFTAAISRAIDEENSFA